MANSNNSKQKASKAADKDKQRAAKQAEKEKQKVDKEAVKLRAQQEQKEYIKKKKLHDEIWAILIIAVGVILVLSLQTSATGAVGAAVQSFLFGCMGKIAYVLAYYCIAIGVLIFAQKASLLSWRSVLFAFLFFLLLCSIYAIYSEPLRSAEGYLTFSEVTSAYRLGKAGGGVIGTAFGNVLLSFFGKVGVWVISIAGILISLLFIIDTPISDFFDSFKVRREATRKAREEQMRINEQLLQQAAQAEPEPEAPAKPEIPETSSVFKAPRAARIEGPKTESAPEPRLDISSVAQFDEPQAEPDPASSIPQNPYDELPEYPEAQPQPEFTPESIGLTSYENYEGYTENQQHILSLVNDDELFGKPAGESFEPYAVSSDGSFTEVPKADIDEVPAQSAETAPAQEVKQKVLPRKYKFPPVSLLNKPSGGKDGGKSDLYDQAKKLEEVLASFGVDASVIDVIKGPAVTRFEVQPATGVKVSSIVRLQDDIALNLRAKSLRIEAPIPGKAAVGIEVSNDSVKMVTLREIIESDEFKKHKAKTAVCLGKSIAGQSIVANLKDMPHLLIAGATGSGKSVCINSIILSLLYKAEPDEVKLLMIDPKVVELSNYNGIPHLLHPVVTEPAKASATLGWAVSEMNDRYNKFAEEGVRDLESYNETVKANGEEEKVLPQIVIIIDELAELIMTAQNSVEDSICRLAQKARAAGMYLIVATQRPSVDVITGVIKANIPSRIAFMVSSHVDSKTILDMTGAEHLLGKGDMLYSPQGISKPIRVQGCFVSDGEVNAVINYLKENAAAPEYDPDVIDVVQRVGSGSASQEGPESDVDELLTDAIETVVRAEKASVSMLQRRFRIGYNRAARLIDQMEERGIVGPADGSNPRKVNMTPEQFEELQQSSVEADRDI